MKNKGLYVLTEEQHEMLEATLHVGDELEAAIAAHEEPQSIFGPALIAEMDVEELGQRIVMVDTALQLIRTQLGNIEATRTALVEAERRKFSARRSRAAAGRFLPGGLELPEDVPTD